MVVADISGMKKSMLQPRWSSEFSLKKLPWSGSHFAMPPFCVISILQAPLEQRRGRIRYADVPYNHEIVRITVLELLKPSHKPSTTIRH